MQETQRCRDAEMQRNWSGREELLLLKFHSGCGLMVGLGSPQQHEKTQVRRGPLCLFG